VVYGRERTTIRMPRPASTTARIATAARERVGIAGATGARTAGVLVMVGDLVAVGVVETVALGVVDTVVLGVGVVETLAVVVAVAVTETVGLIVAVAVLDAVAVVVGVDVSVGVAETDGVLETVGVADAVGVSVAVEVGVLESVGVRVGVALGATMVSIWVLKLVVPATTAQPTLRSGPTQMAAGPTVTSTSCTVF
jgi:hypothetical protein